MSRDWTPREHLAAEEFNIQNGLYSIWDFLERTKFHSINGTVIPVCSKEELALRKQFPLLGKLLSNAGKFSFSALYEKLSNIEGGIDLLYSKDEKLAVYIETGKGDKDSALIKWFNGELDEHFYYSEENHRLFSESLIEEANINAILRLVGNELNETGSIGYTMPDGKHHIYIYVESFDMDGSYFYVVEPNRVVDGACEPMEKTVGAREGDLKELVECCKWCFERFKEDNEVSLENTLENAEERSEETELRNEESKEVWDYEK